MRIATDRPLQHTRNDRLRHWGGSLGSIPSISPFQAKAGEAEYYRLPQPPQSGDPYAAGAVRVQFKVRGRGLA